MPKRIVVLSDGTGQSVGRNDSNVLRLCKLLDLSEGSDQVAIYDPGIGTHVSLMRVETGLELSKRLQLADSNPETLLLRRLHEPFELAFGLGLSANIEQLYRALIREYESGDYIYLFGFSRGAFTVRALAGLIYRCGMLKRESALQVNTALGWCKRHYTALPPEKRETYRAQVDAFRRQHSRPCNIHFLGIWDTVKSVGYLNPKAPPHTRHNPIVKHVRHALSIDERRSFYLNTTWGGLHGESRPALYAPASFDLDVTNNVQGRPQDVKEVWFPGNHADVGGGYPANESAPANNCLRWMLAEAQSCGLRLDPQRYRAVFPLEQDEPVKCRHDEMKDRFTPRIMWAVAEHVFRKELHNEPPPPTKKWTLTPAGPRSLADSLRSVDERLKVVCIHETAREVYPNSSAPWRGVPEASRRFVATIGARCDDC